ncbi:hypothetical protein FACS1894202_12560 [Clostridia bacterium]|nr:hypothetical protein FACS1894202_12560 [Clostridia bacterium]
MDAVFGKLGEIGIVPVVVLEDEALAVPLGRALIAGGVPCAEITFRTGAAAAVIRRLSEELPELLVGAGTVLTPAQADAAKAAGAKFAVAPGLNPGNVRYCRDIGLPMLPGCATPSDIERALDLGLDALKFFPAKELGGLPYIKALAAPYRSVSFMPTGGVSLANLGEYIGFSRVIACGGSYMVSAQLIRERNWDEVSSLCKRSVEIIKNARKAVEL